MQLRYCQTKVSATFTSGSGTAYTAGDSIGTTQTLANVAYENGRIVTLDAILVKDSAAQNKGFTIYFFDATPPAPTDNAAFVWGATLPNCVGLVDIDPSDYKTVNGVGILEAGLKSKRMKLADASGLLYAVAVTADTPTYGAAATVSVDFHFSY